MSNQYLVRTVPKSDETGSVKEDPRSTSSGSLRDLGNNYNINLFFLFLYNLRPLLLQVFYYIFYYKSSIIKRCPKKKENNQG
jgi:hypothetical protein